MPAGCSGTGLLPYELTTPCLRMVAASSSESCCPQVVQAYPTARSSCPMSWTLSQRGARSAWGHPCSDGDGSIVSIFGLLRNRLGSFTPRSFFLCVPPHPGRQRPHYRFLWTFVKCLEGGLVNNLLILSMSKGEQVMVPFGYAQGKLGSPRVDKIRVA